MAEVTCPNCGKPAKRTNTRYGIRDDCDDCGLHSWDGKPLVPDAQEVSNNQARSPKDAISDLADAIDSLALDGILTNAAETKRSIAATIDAANPKRLNISVTVQIAGNANIVSIDLNFGFTFES